MCQHCNTQCESSQPLSAFAIFARVFPLTKNQSHFVIQTVWSLKATVFITVHFMERENDNQPEKKRKNKKHDGNAPFTIE